jgi:hypothetical protein
MAVTMRKVGPDDEKVSVGIFMNTANHMDISRIGPKLSKVNTERKC